MRKNVLSVVAVLLSGSWAVAQQSQPGYATVGSGSKSAGAGVVMPSAAVPPEPGGLGGMPIGAYPAPAGQPLPGPGAAVPMGGPVNMDPGMAYGPGYPGGMGHDFTLDPPSSFGTERMWLSGRYLFGWVSRSPLYTPLVTTGSVADPRPGALGSPSTVVLYGTDQYNISQLSGAQAEIGVNLNDRFYLELSGMILAPRTITSVFASDAAGNPFISRPVFNTLTGDNRSYLTSSPGLVAGATRVEAQLQVWGIEANARYNVKLTPYLDVDGLLGYRLMQMDEHLKISDVLAPTSGTITFLGNPVGSPNTLVDYDQFSTTNRFNGVNIGARFRWQSGFSWFAMNGYGKLAMGATRQTVEIAGASASTTSTTPAAGGILALGSNIGTHERTVFGVIPEGGVGIMILPTRNIRFLAGYSATYWNDVVRPGDTLDPRVNPALVPTDVSYGSSNPGALPAFAFKSRSVWIQSVNFGVEFYY